MFDNYLNFFSTKKENRFQESRYLEKYFGNRQFSERQKVYLSTICFQRRKGRIKFQQYIIFEIPTTTGVLETALYVADLDRGEDFYRSLFDFPVFISDERMRALRVQGQNAQGDQRLLLFKIGGSPKGESILCCLIPPHD